MNLGKIVQVITKIRIPIGTNSTTVAERHATVRRAEQQAIQKAAKPEKVKVR